MQILPDDPGYPVRLTEQWRVPLFYQGNLGALAGPTIAIVGTRDPAPESIKLAFLLGKILSRVAAVISGLARGCDAEAHKGCIDSGGPTVAVLAHGLDTIYPPAHWPLARQIKQGGGLLLSPHPDGTPVESEALRRRNGLIVALSDIVIIVEGSVRSGTAITARAALNQGKPLAVVDSGATLNRHLLEETGALPIRTPDDVAVLIGRLQAATG